MTDTRLEVVDDLVVSLDYTLRLDDEEVIDTSEGQEPLEFLQGRGEIIPGLEQALYGMAVGDEKDVVVAPADGYGEQDPDAFEFVERDVFPPDMDLKSGMGLRMRDSSGQALVAYVTEVRPEEVVLDFNHPLAGETLYFSVKIADLRLATSEELAHGHAHDDSEHEH
jgi:FKBP-type peptidyl-prolyl cis-trans isomerase SlyD